VEAQIALIAEGKADKASVVAHTIDQFRAKFLFFAAKVSEWVRVLCTVHRFALLAASTHLTLHLVLTGGARMA
jgi:hypothetical protein